MALVLRKDDTTNVYRFRERTEDAYIFEDYFNPNETLCVDYLPRHIEYTGTIVLFARNERGEEIDGILTAYSEEWLNKLDAAQRVVTAVTNSLGWNPKVVEIKREHEFYELIIPHTPPQRRFYSSQNFERDIRVCLTSNFHYIYSRTRWGGRVQSVPYDSFVQQVNEEEEKAKKALEDLRDVFSEVGLCRKILFLSLDDHIFNPVTQACLRVLKYKPDVDDVLFSQEVIHTVTR